MSPQSHFLFYNVFFDTKHSKSSKKTSAKGTLWVSPSVLFFSYLPFSKFGTERCLLPGERRGADTKTSVGSVIEPMAQIIWFFGYLKRIKEYLGEWFPENLKMVWRTLHFYFLETFRFFFYLIMILDELNFAPDGSNDTIKKHTKEMEVCSIVWETRRVLKQLRQYLRKPTRNIM